MPRAALSRLFGRGTPVAPSPPGSAAPWDGAFDPRTTAEDVLACFRLLLGRRPNREEWLGHSSRTGEPLPGVVASYVGSLEFARRGLLAAAGTPELTELPGFRIYADSGDAAVGRHVRADAYEPDVTAFFRSFLRPGMGVVDIGANIGWFSMLSASLVGPEGCVVAVEPNGANARMLEASRRANGFGQVTVVQAAAGPAAGLLVLHRSHSNGTTSPLPDEPAALLAADSVPCLPVDAVLPAGRRFDLVKVDVEGAEFLALQGCAALLARDRPVVVSEFAPTMIPGISGIGAGEYLDWLRGRGYALHVIGPDGAPGGEADNAGVMAAFEARGGDHIDLAGVPR